MDDTIVYLAQTASEGVCVVAALPKEKSSSQSPEPEGTGIGPAHATSRFIMHLVVNLLRGSAQDESHCPHYHAIITMVRVSKSPIIIEARPIA